MIPIDITATALKNRLGEIVENASHGTRYRITRNGRVQGAIVSVEDLELLERLDRLQDARDRLAAARPQKGGSAG